MKIIRQKKTTLVAIGGIMALIGFIMLWKSKKK